MSRSIFEDVSGPVDDPSPQLGKSEARRAAARRATRAYLMGLFALVVLMIAVGGLTRLTDSGLSITEWAPISGILPPLTDAAWQAEFEKYRQIPEYQLQNRGMTLAEFKVIYWWEWGHRALGRLVGLVWAVGLVTLLATRRVPRGWAPRLVAIGVLGGAQGVIGWWMVSSGLTGTALDVANHRLATHLGLAFLILGLLGWWVLKLGRAEVELLQARRTRLGGIASLAVLVLVLVYVQVLIGALVAGIDAGRWFTSWPLMAGGVFPPDFFGLSPIWRNLTEDPGTVQWLHRTFGYVVVIAALALWLRARSAPIGTVRRQGSWVALATVAQMALGIATLVWVAPLNLGLAHQLLAVVLVMAVLRLRFLALYPPAQSVRG